jgi:hypothetical protein
MRHTLLSSVLLSSALLSGLLLAACSDSAPPPSAATPSAATEGAAAGHHELEDSIKAQKKYEDKAKHAGDAALDADKQHDKQLEDSGG